MLINLSLNILFYLYSYIYIIFSSLLLILCLSKCSSKDLRCIAKIKRLLSTVWA